MSALMALTTILVVFISMINIIVCLKCYVCDSHDTPSTRIESKSIESLRNANSMESLRNSKSQESLRNESAGNELCNVVHAGEQLQKCPPLTTHCYTICTVDVMSSRHIRRGCISETNISSKFYKQDSETKEKCSLLLCNYDSCNHQTSCDTYYSCDAHDTNARDTTDVYELKLNKNHFTGVGNRSKINGSTTTTATTSCPLSMRKKSSTFAPVTDYPGQTVYDYNSEMSNVEVSDNSYYRAQVPFHWNPSSENTSDGIRLKVCKILVLTSILKHVVGFLIYKSSRIK